MLSSKHAEMETEAWLELLCTLLARPPTGGCSGIAHRAHVRQSPAREPGGETADLCGCSASYTALAIMVFIPSLQSSWWGQWDQDTPGLVYVWG